MTKKRAKLTERESKLIQIVAGALVGLIDLHDEAVAINAKRAAREHAIWHQDMIKTLNSAADTIVCALVDGDEKEAADLFYKLGVAKKGGVR